MMNITCILDACTVINLIHIDEDEFLIKRLTRLNVHICEKVFNEVNANVFSKLDIIKRNQGLKEEEINSKKKAIDLALTFFRGLQITNARIVNDLGESFFETIHANSNYHKNNGEFYSTTLAIYLTTTMPTKLFFHTDDYPARHSFEKFYLMQQIGQIEDTADLLLLLYRLDDTFSLRQLDKFLSDLFSEYAMEVSILEKKLKDISSSLPVQLRLNKEFSKALNSLINNLHNLDFEGIGVHKEFFFRNRSRNKLVCDVLEIYEDVFYLETYSTDLLDKMKDLRKSLQKVYCFL